MMLQKAELHSTDSRVTVPNTSEANWRRTLCHSLMTASAPDPRKAEGRSMLSTDTKYCRTGLRGCCDVPLPGRSSGSEKQTKTHKRDS